MPMFSITEKIFIGFAVLFLSAILYSSYQGVVEFREVCEAQGGKVVFDGRAQQCLKDTHETPSRCRL